MLKVIFIDDEPYVLTCTPQLLDWNSMGIEIVGLFDNISEAKEFISNNAVDIVFTDISMPNGDGFDIAAFCNEHFPEIKIIFISAYKSFDFAQRAFSFNVFDYLSKPLTYGALTKTLDRIVSKQNTEINNGEFDVVNLTKKFLEENYAKDISLNLVAASIGLSPAYFSSIYKSKSGEAFITTLNKIRIKHAKELLQNRSIKISHINNMIGYQSKSYFFKIFKELCGISPKEYRDMLNRNNKP